MADDDTRVDRVQRAGDASEAALAPYAILDTAPEAVYDGLAQLASDLCEAPVGLLTLFESRRQWFKAAVGFDGSETTLRDSLCQHAIDAGDVLVIPDTSTDPRTRDNILVIGDPRIRFYAGAPLRAPDGTFLGTLCVIDFAPRSGLTAAQASGLRVLADQVMAMFELRRLLRERDAALDVNVAEKDRLASSEAHWRGLFEGLREGFMVGEAIRDGAGRVVDWRHLEANTSFGHVVGFPLDALIGKTIRELAPQIQTGWIDFVGIMLKRGTSQHFGRTIRRAGRSYDGRIFPIGGDQFAAIFLDVTDRIETEERQAALIALGDGIRDLDRIEDITTVASRIVGETLDAIRAGYGRMDASREHVDIEHDWTAPGAASIAGRFRFADWSNLGAGLIDGEPLVIGDIRTDPRTAADPGPRLAMGTVSLACVPIRERGRTVALLFVHSGRPRVWTEGEVSFLRDVGDRLELAIERLERETRRVLQNQELSHRVKNTLAMVQAIASQTLKPITERAAVENFEQRLTALATAHDVLLGTDWEVAPLMDVVRSVLASVGQEDRIAIAGPPVLLSPRAVLSASLLVHELATNAVKYGSLSAPAGRVTIDWQVRPDNGRDHLVLTWAERGGPSATVPTRRGFGSRLINMGLVGTGGVELDYTSSGLTARMAAPVDDLTKT